MTIVANKEYDISSSKEFRPIIGKINYGLQKIKDGKLFFNKNTEGFLNSDPDRTKMQIDTTVGYTRGLNE